MNCIYAGMLLGPSDPAQCAKLSALLQLLSLTNRKRAQLTAYLQLFRQEAA